MAGRSQEGALRFVRLLSDLPRVLSLPEQPRVLDRDRRLMGQADEETQVRVRESVTGTRSPDGHHPDHVTAGQQRGGHQPFLRVVHLAGDRHRALVAGGVVHHFRYGPVREVTDDALAELDRVGHDELREMAERNDRHERPGLLFQEDGARIGLQQFAGSLGDAAQDGIEVEHPAHLAPEVGQGRNLARPALGFAVQPGVLDRHADVGGDRRHQPRVVLAETSGLLRALHADHPDRATGDQDGHAQVRPSGCADHLHADLFERLGAVEQQRFALPQDP